MERRMESGDAPGTELAAGLPKSSEFIPPGTRNVRHSGHSRASAASEPPSGAGHWGPASEA